MTVASSSRAAAAPQASSTSSWPYRHDSIQRCLAEAAVQTALSELTRTPHVRRALSEKAKGKAKAHSDSDERDLLVDLALETFWSSSRLGTRDINTTRLRALSHLQQLSKISLETSDFPSVTSLQRSSAAYVEIVRSRFNRQLYVLKTVVKGLARRESNRCNPSFEAQLLAAGQQESQSRRPVPDFVASFQSQNSLHIVMQYFPAGDLDQLLHSAGQAGLIHGFGKDGGLLSESYVKIYSTDIVAAVTWCHEQGFAHRDVKPANFLLDRSGHLKLCDFATAAPFTQYGSRRRVQYQYSCLAGTPDYIAPDILLGEEERLNALTGSRGASSRWGFSFADESSFSSLMTRPQPESEGFYGPEVDWWSVGCVIYEMVFKNVPFWAETIREAHHRICNHEQYLQLDEQVTVSSTLKDLIIKLLTHRETRLGSQASAHVQQHSFFSGVDWSSYLNVAAPFVPNVDSTKTDVAGMATAEEPSILHSPSVMAGRPQAALDEDQSISIEPDSFHLSQMFDGSLDEFPMFADSPEEVDMVMARRAAMVEAPSRSRPLSEPVSPNTSKIGAAKWSDIDVAWVGFSRLPQRNAFTTEKQFKTMPQSTLTRVAATPSAAARQSTLASIWETSPGCESMAASPEAWPRAMQQGESSATAPITSTPFTRSVSDPAKQSPPPMIASTPRDGGIERRLSQRRRLHKAIAAAIPGDGRYVTPLRKTSMPNLSSAYSGSVAPPSAIPASPYPFPLAATPAPATAARRLVSASSSIRNPSLLRSAVAQQQQQQRRSESPYSRVVSMGSDSRCSGGSNAKRNFSENEAMEQLEAAVLQSARKVRLDSQERSFPRRLAVLEERVGADARRQLSEQGRLSRQAGPSRPQLPHSNTEPALLSMQKVGGSLDKRPQLQELRRGSAPSVVVEPASPTPTAVHSSAPQTLAPIEKTDGKGSSTIHSRRLLGAHERRRPRLPMPDPIVIRPTLTSSPEDGGSDPDSPLMSRSGSSAGQSGGIGYDAHITSSVDLPGWSTEAIASAPTIEAHQQDPSHLCAPSARPMLRMRRSDRQLKLEAQERTTPTRPKTRASSPFTTTEFDLAHLSLGPPTPLEEVDINPMATAAAAAAIAAASPSPAGDSRQNDCPTPELVSDHTNDSEESGVSSGGESFRTHSAMSSPFAMTFAPAAANADGALALAMPTTYGKDALPRLSVPTTAEGAARATLAASRLRATRSHSQLSKLHHLSLGFGREHGVRPEGTSSAAGPASSSSSSSSSSTSTIHPAQRSIRRKDSRETLKEYRNSARLQSSSGLPSFPEDDDDAFGGGPALVSSSSPPLSGAGLLAAASAKNLSSAMSGSASGTWSRKSLSATRRASAQNLGRQYRFSEGASTMSRPSTALSAAAGELKLSAKRSSSDGSVSPTSTSTVVRSNMSVTSPLTKMDNRLTGIQSSVFGLQTRITKLKAKLHD
ncbi:hypothetical protein BDZ90DRAFT_230311 [Jaminaea rosea]|uniref:Protein kinase domain-containing protein n=1 Tax=Jaminaea rosea TaxID=1569628 RepID=A0A316UVX2_9BASI|nr:hypothetical protein BDZ90DRAFT_230311 [Jaminaea rosea]PWN29440.1 hypothetical protein BDZ90DRAFT_230311 [Jaminaea rosea]